MTGLIYAALYLFVFIVGACIGSFMNVVIFRVPRKLNIAKGRSFCPGCGRTLTASDLIPILSWVFLGGKCRTCKCNISARYPLGEALCGIFAVLSVFLFHFTPQAVIIFTSACILYAVAWIDIDTMEIPNSLVIALIVPAVCAAFFVKDVGWLARGIGFFAVSVPLLLTNLIKKDSFGGGDIKLCAVCGFLLGWKLLLVGTFIALLTGGGYGIYCLIRKKKGKGDRFAFGPFLSLGFTAALYAGEVLLGAYLSLIGF